LKTSNVEKEKAVIGALVLHNLRDIQGYDAYLISKLRDEFFTHKPVKEIFKLASSNFSAGVGIDYTDYLASVTTEAAQVIQEALLADFIPSTSIDRYINELGNLAILRPKVQMLAQCMQQVNQADSIEKGYGIIQELAANLLGDEIKSPHTQHLSEIVDEVMSNDDEPEYFKTNLKDWPPFPSKGMITIGGRSGVGKTLMGLHLMENILQVKPGTQAIYFNLEMDKRVMLSRYQNMIRPFKGSLKKTLEDGGASETLKRDVTLVSKSGLELSEIQMTASCCALKKPVSVIVVDYVGQVKDKGGDEYQELGRIAKGLSGLAYKLGCVVIALQQVKRKDSQKKEGDTTPHTYEAAGTLDFERSSEWWLGIDQPQMHRPDEATVKDIFVIKNRKSRGDTGYFTVYHGFKDARFFEIDQHSAGNAVNNPIASVKSYKDAYK